MNKKLILNILKNLGFLALGVLIFWWVFKDVEIEDIKKGFREVNYFWIALSITLAIMSQLSRAIRWKMLIKSIDYNPRLMNVFLSTFVLYLVNLIVPRAGEVARCTVVSRTDKVPFTKLLGTVVVERLADVIMLATIAVVIFATNLEVVGRFLDQHPEMQENIQNMLTLRNLILLVIAGLAGLGFVYYLFKKSKNNPNKKEGKLAHLKNQLAEGLSTILKLKKRVWWFVFHTAFIFLMWLLMLYVVFLAYEPTSHLTIRTAAFVFLMGGLAMLLPVQGGIGPWHFMIIQTLLLYGIPADPEGTVFSFIAHTTTQLVYIVLGAVALLVVLFINQKNIKESKTKEVETAKS